MVSMVQTRSRISSERARAPKKYTTNSFQVVGLHNVIA